MPNMCLLNYSNSSLQCNIWISISTDGFWKSGAGVCEEFKYSICTHTHTHLFICLEEALWGRSSQRGTQWPHHRIGNVATHSGRVRVQDANVALIALHHQVQRPPFRVHGWDFYCIQLSSENTGNIKTQLADQLIKQRFSSNRKWHFAIHLTKPYIWTAELSLTPRVFRGCEKTFICRSTAACKVV